MRSMSILQMAGGVAVAGVVAAGTTAFTGAGLTVSAAAGYVGGTATHTVNGATIDTVTYHYTTAPAFDYVTLHFANTNSATKAVTASASGGSYSGGTQLACQAVDATVAQTSICEVQTSGTYSGTPSGTYSGLSSLSITVA